MINIAVEVHVLSNQTVKIDYVRLGRLVPSERDKSSRIWHILSVIRYTHPTRDARKMLEDPTLKWKFWNIRIIINGFAKIK